MDVLDRLKRAACGLLEKAPRWISLPLLVLWRGVVRWLVSRSTECKRAFSYPGLRR